MTFTDSFYRFILIGKALKCHTHDTTETEQQLTQGRQAWIWRSMSKHTSPDVVGNKSISLADTHTEVEHEIRTRYERLLIRSFKVYRITDDKLDHKFLQCRQKIDARTRSPINILICFLLKSLENRLDIVRPILRPSSLESTEEDTRGHTLSG